MPSNGPTLRNKQWILDGVGKLDGSYGAHEADCLRAWYALPSVYVSTSHA